MKKVTFISAASIFSLFIFLVTGYNQRLLAQGEVSGGIDDSVGTVFNKHGAVLGFIKENGQI